MRDEIGTLYSDWDFATLFPTDGQPAICPWRLALICVMQFIEGLSDRQAFPLRFAAVSIATQTPIMRVLALSGFSSLSSPQSDRRPLDISSEQYCDYDWNGEIPYVIGF